MFGAGPQVAMNPERPQAMAAPGAGGRGAAAAPGETPGVSSELVVRALNYHGQQLTSFLKESPLYEGLDLRAVDYHLYHQVRAGSPLTPVLQVEFVPGLLNFDVNSACQFFLINGTF